MAWVVHRNSHFRLLTLQGFHDDFHHLLRKPSYLKCHTIVGFVQYVLILSQLEIARVDDYLLTLSFQSCFLIH